MIRGRNVLIATGSSPRALAVDGLAFDGERVLSSDDVLQLDTTFPARVAVIGGGAIGCEFASFLVDVGAEVTILEALPQILAGVDQQVAQTVVRAFQKRGIKTHTGVRVLGFDGDGRALRGQERRGAARRSTRSSCRSGAGRARENIGLDGAGVKVDERGFVVVDGNMRTSVDGVYAVGDVVATPQLAHVAFSEAIVAIKTMLGEAPAADRLRQGPVGHLLPPRGRVLRAHRGAGERARLRRRDVGAPLDGQRARADRRRDRRDDEDRRRARRRRSSACTSPGRGRPS